MSESVSPYWDRFYTQVNDRAPLPSQFAVFVALELGYPHIVLELGSGSGFDAAFLSGAGHYVIGIDTSKVGREAAARHCSSVGEEATFVGDQAALVEALAVVPNSAPRAAFARFFFHAVTDEDEGAYLELVSGLLRPGECLYCEYRTPRDANLKKVFGGHDRRYVEPDELSLRALSFELHTVYSVEGRGFAKFGSEDAIVARQILRRS